MQTRQLGRRRLAIAIVVVALGGCSEDSTTQPAVQATLRVTCERSTNPDRSKISVDANDMSPQGGSFRARVTAAGGTVTSPGQQAAGDEVEFDFDSNSNDVAAGATAIAATFITARSEADVVGELLTDAGQVVASQSVDCQFR